MQCDVTLIQARDEFAAKPGRQQSTRSDQQHGGRHDRDTMGERPFERRSVPPLDTRDQPIVALFHRSRHEQRDGGGNERQ